MYKWVYPNDTDVSQSASLYTLSPVVNVIPKCNTTLSLSRCTLNLTVIFETNVASTFLNISSQSNSIQLNRSNLNFTAAAVAGEDHLFRINCITSCCKGKLLIGSVILNLGPRFSQTLQIRWFCFKNLTKNSFKILYLFVFFVYFLLLLFNKFSSTKC